MNFDSYLLELAARINRERDDLPVSSDWHHCYPEWVDAMVELPDTMRAAVSGSENFRGWVWHVVEVDGVLLFFRFLKCMEPGRTEPLSLKRGIPMMVWYPPSNHTNLQKKLPGGYRPVVEYHLDELAAEDPQMCLFGKEAAS